MEQLFSEAQDGKGAVVVVAGATGTGKTALLQAMIERVTRRDGSCFSVTAAASERPYPFGLLEQLIKVMCAGGMADPGAGAEADAERSDPFAGFQQVYRAIHEFARTRPILIGIDDVHFADEQSLRFLGYLIRRTVWSPVIMVVTGASSYEREQSLLHAEMLHLSHCHRLRLAPLSATGVEEWLADRLGAPPEPPVVDYCLAVSGGVPLLMQALLDDGVLGDDKANDDKANGDKANDGKGNDGKGNDGKGSGGKANDDKANGGKANGGKGNDGKGNDDEDDGVLDRQPGAAFRQAVLRSLHRSEPGVAAIARSMAVLGAGAGPSLIGEFLGTDLPRVQAGVTQLHAMGLLAAGEFRHEQTRLAVLASVPEEDLPAQRGRAAELLYRSGAAAGAVADQLLAARGPGDAEAAPGEPTATPEGLGFAAPSGASGAGGGRAPEWSAPIVREAARDAMAAGDVARAVDYLRHAVTIGTDAERVPTTVLLADAQWHADPGKAVRHLDDLARDARAGLLSAPDALVLVNQLLWWGRAAEADEITLAIATAYGWRIGDGDCAVPEADTCRALLWTVFRRAGRTDRGAAAPPEQALEVWSGPMVAVLHLTSVATLENGGGEVEQADQMLRGLRAGSSVTPALYALVLLVQTGRLAEAIRWSDRLLEEEWIRRVPMRRVMFELVKSVAAIRQGAYQEARRCVDAVLALAPPASWGIVAGLPLGLGVRAATEQGDFAAARSYLNFPVPAAMFDTPFALLYLQALGRYHLAMGHPRTALTHFQSSADLMTRWTGTPAPAEPPPPEGVPATVERRGTTRKTRRPPGEEGPRPARGRHLLAVGGEPAGEAEAAGGAELTDAERRVAALAAAGDTNRQIARKLFITVSTVEQHLTKIYRKLNVRSRAALSGGLREFRG